MLERNRSGKLTKIPCRTSPFTDEKKRSYLGSCLLPGEGRVLIYSVPRPSAPWPALLPLHSSQGPLPDPPHPRNRGGGPWGPLSVRPSPAPPEQGNVPPQSTSPRVLAKALGPALRGKKGLGSQAFRLNPVARHPGVGARALRECPPPWNPGGPARGLREAAKNAQHQAARPVWRPGKGSICSEPAERGRVPPPQSARAGARPGARPAQPMGAALGPPPPPREKSELGRR